MTRSLREAAHVLGLKNNPFNLISPNESMCLADGVPSTVTRFNQISHDNKALNYLDINEFLKHWAGTWAGKKEFISRIQDLTTNDYLGFAAEWIGHTFSIHLIQKENITHFIYVNKGERLESPRHEHQDKTVLVFSVSQNNTEKFVDQLFNALQSRDKKEISNFFRRDEVNQFLDVRLTEFFQKKAQKTGNCTIANSNIAWHF